MFSATTPRRICRSFYKWCPAHSQLSKCCSCQIYGVQHYHIEIIILFLKSLQSNTICVNVLKNIIVSFQAIKVIMAIDATGVLLGWKFLDHAAHLGGGACGM